MTPVILIGAGRSGTNLLRDLATTLDGVGTWPCDEINYIWRHGNVRHPTDELTAAHARPEVARYVRRRFDALARRRGAEVVVEKTCANSLRVPFVHAVLPEARFIHIVRDGHDVVASAMKRWTAELDVAYVARKARYVPPADLPYYATRYLADRLHRFRTSERRLGSWGPRFSGLQEALATRTLAEVCALQWRACVERATADLAAVDPARVFTLRYASLVEAPERHLDAVGRFVGADPGGTDLAAATARVSARSVGNGRRELSEADFADVGAVVAGVALPRETLDPHPA